MDGWVRVEGRSVGAHGRSGRRSSRWARLRGYETCCRRRRGGGRGRGARLRQSSHSALLRWREGQCQITGSGEADASCGRGAGAKDSCSGGGGASRLTRAAAPRPGLWPVDEERRAPEGAFEVEALWLDERVEEEEEEKEAAAAPCGQRAEETMLMESGG
jgi:hypothetical protein